MRQFRRQTSWAWLGLVILAIQSVASFGHFHDLAPPGPLSQPYSLATSDSGRPQAHGSLGHGSHRHGSHPAHHDEMRLGHETSHRRRDHGHHRHPHSGGLHADHAPYTPVRDDLDRDHDRDPDHDHDHRHDHDHCDVCWSIRALTNAVLPSPAELPAVEREASAREMLLVSTLRRTWRTRANLARAPPRTGPLG